MALAGPMALAQDHPVVVELFTSQGCPYCPPADALLIDLVEREDVIALALHVDIWDYLGWADRFADPAYTKRQKNYARAFKIPMVYTPQFVVAGQVYSNINSPSAVAAAIKHQAAEATGIQLQAKRDGNRVEIKVQAAKGSSADMVIQIVRYLPKEVVSIRRGENAGRTIAYSNIVQSWTSVKSWNGRRPLSFSARVAGSDPVVVIVQMADYGPIVAAVDLR